MNDRLPHHAFCGHWRARDHHLGTGLPAAMNVFTKCTVLMPMIAIANFTFNTEAICK